MPNSNQPKMGFVPKGWGYEKWIVNKSQYCGKILFFSKGRKCSLHYHKDKDETFYVQSGKLKLLYGDFKEVEELLDRVGKNNLSGALEVVILEKGDNFYIPPGRVHQMIALEDTELFEFSTEHRDSDSHRIIKGD